MDDESIDLVVTSPPYDDLRDYKGYSFDFESIAKELFRVVKTGGVVVWVVGDAVVDGSETGTSFKQALFFKEIGFNIHDTMIYEKENCPFPDKTRYNQIFEYMFVLSKGRPSKINLITDRKNTWSGTKTHGTLRKKDGKLIKRKSYDIKETGTRNNVWKYSTGLNASTKDKIAFEHPAIFPEKLCADQIFSWSNEGDLVYDPFGGSGTTAKMSHIYKRNWILSEMSKEYTALANRRIEKYVTQIDIFDQGA